MTGGADGRVRIWAKEAADFECVTEIGVNNQFAHPGSSVLEVAWRGYNGIMADLIASVGED